MNTETLPTSAEEAPVESRPRIKKAPLVDILENEERFLLIADLPGVSKDNLEIVLEKGVLRLSATLDSETPDNRTAVHSEYRPATSYERSFRLGEGVSTDDISAEIRDGVLRLTVPKLKAEVQRIAIRSDSTV